VCGEFLRAAVDSLHQSKPLLKVTYSIIVLGACALFRTQRHHAALTCTKDQDLGSVDDSTTVDFKRIGRLCLTAPMFVGYHHCPIF